MKRDIHYIKRESTTKNSFREMFKIKQVNCEFAPIWRVFISGSSSAGKTHLARQILETKLFDYHRVHYYHPDIDETNPAKWENYLNVPVIYQVGLPSSQDLIELPPQTCIVLDDLYREASSSKHIDYLFRVLSGKLKLHVIIMTQRYFAGGPYALNIRNSSNYHVLMNNADCRINDRAANRLGLKTEYHAALRHNQSKLYPYVFIDQTNSARVTRLQVYVDILSKHKKVVIDSMIYFLISERDFNSTCKQLDQNTAQYVDQKPKKEITAYGKENVRNEDRNEKAIKSDNRNSGYSKPSRYEKYLERRRIERTVKGALQKHHRCSKL